MRWERTNVRHLRLNAPDSLMNSNQRLHHHARARLTATWRQAAGTMAMASRPVRFTGRTRIVCVVHHPHNRSYDAGNYYPTAKACVDGFVDAGMFVDDSNQWVVGPDMRAGDPSGLKYAVLEFFFTPDNSTDGETE